MVFFLIKRNRKSFLLFATKIIYPVYLYHRLWNYFCALIYIWFKSQNKITILKNNNYWNPVNNVSYRFHYFLDMGNMFQWNLCFFIYPGSYMPFSKYIATLCCTYQLLQLFELVGKSKDNQLFKKDNLVKLWESCSRTFSVKQAPASHYKMNTLKYT